MSFAEEWARCGPWLQAALDHAGGGHELADVRALVTTRKAQFWPGRRSACISRVDEQPRERRLLLWLAGGDLQELRERQLPRMEAFARLKGCRRLLVIGRAGWERSLKAQGFTPIARLIAKDLSE